jgi:predicted  nucleic acid-binding Zn-ribbon protein
VESARHDLELMIRLQGVYEQIASAIAERGSPPDEVRELQEANRLRLEELEAMEQRAGEREAELTEVRRKESEWQLELEHFQRQKAMVSNEREFTAVISEIDYATKALGELAARRTQLEGELEELRCELVSRREARPEEEETQRTVTAAWESRRDELRDRIHGLSQEARSIEADLQPTNRARFLRLLERKRGTAMAPVIDGSCSVCHFSLRPHLMQRVRRAQEIISCEHCHRILFLPEQVSHDPS